MHLNLPINGRNRKISEDEIEIQINPVCDRQNCWKIHRAAPCSWNVLAIQFQ